MLDKLPASVRHTAIAFGAALLSWAAIAVMNIEIEGNVILTGVVTSFGSALITQLTLWFTPLVKQYGVGSTGE